jgi:hypothetical protein
MATGAAYLSCPRFAAKILYGLPCPTGELLDVGGICPLPSANAADASDRSNNATANARFIWFSSSVIGAKFPVDSLALSVGSASVSWWMRPDGCRSQVRFTSLRLREPHGPRR